MKECVARALLAACFLFLVSLPVHAAQLVDINTADKETLKTLSGIGDVKAQAIIDYRNAHGPFANIEDITNVSGIGPATFNNIKNFITVGDGLSAQSETPTQTQSSAQSSSDIGGMQAALSPPPSLIQQVFASAGKNRDVIASADVLLEGQAYDANGKRLDDTNVQFSWTFGDGGAAVGRIVSHRWSEPGRYAVVLEATQGLSGASAQITVQAYPLSADLFVRGNALVVSNTSPRELDLSNWRLRGRGATFTIPEHTTLLAGALVPFPQEITHLIPEDAALLYPSGLVAAAAGEPPHTASTTASVSAPSSLPASSSRNPVAQRQTPAPPPSAAPEAGGSPTEGTTQDVAEGASTTFAEAAAAGSTLPDTSRMWWFAAAALSAAAGGSLIAARRFGKKEWDIVEEKAE